MAVGTGRCEDCVYYDYDEEYDEDVCTLNLDQDDEERFQRDRTARYCRYYKYYEPYKSVQKQN